MQKIITVCCTECECRANFQWIFSWLKIIIKSFSVNSFLLTDDEMSLSESQRNIEIWLRFIKCLRLFVGVLLTTTIQSRFMECHRSHLTQYPTMNKLMESDFVINFLVFPYSTETCFRWMWCWEFWHIENYISHVREVKLVWHMALNTIV